jgi:1-acyl-sn-glycerol-3-phosphate acyltransferase
VERRAIEQCLYPAASAGFKLTLRLFAKFEVSGRENVPAQGPLIVVSNHLSNLDPAIVASLLVGKPGFLAKSELFKNPALRCLLKGYGAFPVDRGRADVRALNWAVHRLKAGGIVVVFPEGTRSRGAGLLKAHSGPVLLATMSGAPLLPVALTGSEPLQNLARVLMPRADMTATIGRPFTIDAGPGRIGREALERAASEMMWRIASMLPEAYRGHYKDGLPAVNDVTRDVQDSQRA